MDMMQFAGSGRFLKVADLDGGSIQETIGAIGPGKYDKANATFESGAVLSLNVTNTRALIKAYGTNSADWIGKVVELYIGKIEVRDGDIKDAILVRPVSPPLPPAQRTKLAPSATPAPKALKPNPDPFNDPIDDFGH